MSTNFGTGVLYDTGVKQVLRLPFKKESQRRTFTSTLHPCSIVLCRTSKDEYCLVSHRDSKVIIKTIC